MSGHAGLDSPAVWVAQCGRDVGPARETSCSLSRRRSLAVGRSRLRPSAIRHPGFVSDHPFGDLDLDACGRRPIGRGYIEDHDVNALLLDPGHCIGRRRPTPHRSARSAESPMQWPCRTRGSRPTWLPRPTRGPPTGNGGCRPVCPETSVEAIRHWPFEGSPSTNAAPRSSSRNTVP